jgi:hypothetical protein
MPALEARVATDRADRYLAQLCRHADHMSERPGHRPPTHRPGGDRPQVRQVERTETDAVVTLDLGRFTARATPDALLLRAEADSEEALQRIQTLLATRLEKIGRRDRMTVTWERTDTAAPAAPAEAGPRPIVSTADRVQPPPG